MPIFGRCIGASRLQLAKINALPLPHKGRQSLWKPNAKEAAQSAKWTDCNYYSYCHSHYCKVGGECA